MTFLRNPLVFIFIVMMLSACNSKAQQSFAEIKPIENTVAEKQWGSKLGQRFNNVLLAEIYNQFGEAKQSVKHYQLLIEQTEDAVITKRATEIAAKTGHLAEGLEAVNRWLELSPESLEARQYLALLLLRSGEFESSADQLQIIRSLVEKDQKKNHAKDLYSKGLKFIGSLLSIESHHKKSFAVYQQYLKNYGSEIHQTQQNLVLASLAMKAKEYEIVISSLNEIETPQTFAETVLMKAKAYQKLNKTSDAVHTLKSYVDEQDSSDSTKLELIRLLIIDKQKSTAGKYLKALVKKHPDNKDLLKSLIALEIDQSQLTLAKQNIERLKKYDDYRSDAEYFSGEVMEAEGDIQNALQSYLKVKKGSLLKRAKKKILVLNRLLNKGLKPKKVNFEKK